MSAVRYEQDGPVVTITYDRPEALNAVNGAMREGLNEAWARFRDDPDAWVAVVTGAGRAFCAGADLKDLPTLRDSGPMGPTRLGLTKPVIAAIEGWCVAGGIELAAWCDLRVAGASARFGCLERRWGVPLIDGGTIRLPRLVGHSHALDLILTGRGVSGDEVQRMGLANRLTQPGDALAAALDLAHQLAAFPQRCLRSDRESAYRQWGLGLDDALALETDLGLAVIRSGETAEGATRFAGGEGRHGAF